MSTVANALPYDAGFGDAAEGDLEAGGAEFADVAVHVPLAVVVVRAEVLISHAGVSQQLGGLQLGVPGGGARLGRAALAGQSPAAGAFAGLGPAGCHGGLAGDGARYRLPFLALARPARLPDWERAGRGRQNGPFQ